MPYVRNRQCAIEILKKNEINLLGEMPLLESSDCQSYIANQNKIKILIRLLGETLYSYLSTPSTLSPLLPTTPVHSNLSLPGTPFTQLPLLPGTSSTRSPLLPGTG